MKKGEHNKLKDGNHSGFMGLIIAVRFSHNKVVEFLLRQPGIALRQTSCGTTALYYACIGNNGRGLQLLLAQPGVGGVVNRRSARECAPLMVAVQHGHADCVKVLLGVEGVDLDIRDDQGKGLQEWAR